VPWSGEGFHFHIPDCEDFSISEEDIRIGNRGSFAESDFGSCFFSEDATSRDVIRMDMRIEDIGECESEFREEPQVSLDLISHGVDDNSLMRGCITDDIGIGPRLFVEELAEDNRVHILTGEK
jgi:hypothetical protein